MNSLSASKDDTALGSADAGAESIHISARESSALVPQLGGFGITEEDLATAIRVLDAISSLDPKKRRQQQKKRKRNERTSDDSERTEDVNDGKGGGDNNDDDDDGLARYRRPDLRSFRKSLSACLALHQLTMYEGKSESEYYEKRLADRTLKRQKMAERAQQRKYVAATDLRKGRMDRLERLREESKGEEEERQQLLMQYLVPDGHVDTASNENGAVADYGVKMLENGNDADANGKRHSSANGGTDDDDSRCNPNDRDDDTTTTTVLPKLRSCYSCKARFRIMHHFYDQLCPTCAPYNYAKRHQSADMSGRVAVVTGSRVKIGYHVCLKLLRAGATVVATTRFPNNAVAAYRREKDFDAWRGRLNVYGLDLRDVTGLEAFTRYLRVTYGDRGIDVVINNACQTVRRPGGYYAPLVLREGELWTGGDEAHRDVLRGCVDFERIRRRLVASQSDHEVCAIADGGSSSIAGPVVRRGLLLGGDSSTKATDERLAPECDDIIARQNPTIKEYVPFESTGISHSVAMSQMEIVPEDVGVDEKVMPRGLSDINGQQLDLRTQNSWLLKMDEVSTPEIMECMFVNAIAPFVLNSRLKPLMEAPAGDPNRPDRYIINVSAMEGKFYRYKMPNHPHTNMAKAALNMLTRTSSEDLAKRSRIYMNSVDTGWINDENPLEKASKIAKTNLFQTPIDEVDAAARILDPVFVGINSDATPECDKVVKDYGKFFKDYKETEW
ncbi:hypothetical protein ACHAW5_009613 [Stephanodiscus triporus]|uniref:Oxidoreductase n=1 Tax=Stephanodiscus triporus TaxID=2934178 RepID=A0ABD3NSD9_9STRA